MVRTPTSLKPSSDYLPVKTRGKGGVNTLFQNAKQVHIQFSLLFLSDGKSRIDVILFSRKLNKFKSLD
jgi:hypothetical protein